MVLGAQDRLIIICLMHDTCLCQIDVTITTSTEMLSIIIINVDATCNNIKY